MPTRIVLALVLVLPLALSCQAPEQTLPDAGEPAVPDAGAVPPSIEWMPCALHTEGDGPEASCATIRTPLERTDPARGEIDVFVKRFRPAGGRGLRALWMLQGGPGASGYVFERLSEVLATRFPDVDYYMPDHRGTGRSSRISCPEQEADDSEGGLAITADEWPDCLAHAQSELGSGLAAFDTSNAANDLAVLIDQARVPGQPVFLYGVSYGTYWAHRFLQLRPDDVDGVVLDSVAPPGISLLRQDEDANEAVRDFLAVCEADAVCGAKFERDPWVVAQELVTRLKAGHCADIAVDGIETHVLLRRAFGSMLMDASLRRYIPAIIRRVDRCAARDLRPLRTLFRALTAPQPTTPELELWGWVLTYNVLLSELSETPALTAAELAAIRDGAVASRDVTLGFEPMVGRWPLYTPDPLATTFAETRTPLLFLHGGLDPATLLRRARVMQTRFTAPHQTWVEFPTATHTTIGSTPFIDEVGELRSCGSRLLKRFIESPREPVDTACVEEILPLDFSLPNEELNRGLFGTSNAWE